MKTIATIVLGTAALLATVPLTSCTSNPPPGLTLTPVKFGGEHASLLSTMAGKSCAYRLQYNGDATAYRIEMEWLEKGESVARRELLAGTFKDLMQDSPPGESIDMLLAFLVIDPRREGESTEITAVISGPSGSYHRDHLIPEWDAMGGYPGASYGGQYEPLHFQSASEPVVLYFWAKGSHNQGDQFRHVGETARACMLLTLQLED